MDPSAAPDDLPLGQSAVQKGILRQEQLDEGLRELTASQSRGETPKLCEILIRQGAMTTDDLVRLVREQSQRAEGLPPLPRYDVQARLGEGATAVVYRAWDRDLRRSVALKMLRESAGFSDVGRQRFRREAQAAAGLTHPNVITVHDAGEVEGRLYLVMEIVEGKPLSDSLRNPELPLQDRIRLIEGAARGVAAAHEKGIVHRDLKPQNILVAAGGVPKVADFGLAHMVDSTTALTRTGTTLGTPLYMSPEQVEGKSRDITPRTDVWALGAMLYETLAGAPPFIGETQLEIYQKISRLDPPPQQLMPRDLETVALKALEKDPARRYPSAREFADDLRRYLDGQAIAARRPPPWVRAWKRLSRRRAVIVVAAALLAAGGWIGAHQWRQAAKMRAAMSLAAEDERLGRFQEARDGYRLARELEPSNGEALRGLQRTEDELARRRQALLEQAKLQEEAVRFMKPSLIETVVGKVKLVTDFTRDNAQAGQNLLPGNGLETIGPESFARIKYLNVASMELDGETLIHQWLEESAAGGTKAVSVKRGALRVSIPSALPGRPLMFSTPHLDVQSAPASFRLIVTPRSTRFLVEQGALRATRRADGVAVLVEQGFGLECGAKGLMAPEPLAAPGGRLLADFESHVEHDWVPDVQSKKGTLAMGMSRPGLQGSGSMKMQYSVPATEMAWASLNYPASQDWSSFSGVSFWFNGTKAGAEVFLEVLENVEKNQPGRNSERFWYRFMDDFVGWKKFDLTWTQFKRRWFPNSPDDGVTRPEVWGLTLIVIAPGTDRQGVAEFDQLELTGPAPAASAEPWKPAFNGKTLDGFVREGPATWRVENGALVRDPAVREQNAMQTSAKFGDAEIRIRFDVVQDLDHVWFAARQSEKGNYSVGWRDDDAARLKGRPHELILLARGETVSATLDGRSIPVVPNGRPRDGALQFDSSGPGLRIFSIEQRSLRP